MRVELQTHCQRVASWIADPLPPMLERFTAQRIGTTKKRPPHAPHAPLAFALDPNILHELIEASPFSCKSPLMKEEYHNW